LNKMDLVSWSFERFDEMGSELVRYARAVGLSGVELVPTSALLGDNIVNASANTPWYEGKPLLELLETLEVRPAGRRSSPRLAVQYVVRKHPSGPSSAPFRARYYAGTVTGGSFVAGQEVVVLPAGRRTRLAELRGPGGRALEEATHAQAVTVSLADDLDVGRGDVLSPPDDQPLVARGLEAMVCAMSEAQPLASGSTYHMLVGRALHTVRLQSLVHRVDTDTLALEDPGPTLGLNEIGRAEIVSDTEVVFDPYRTSRHTGGFVLVDPGSNLTVGAGTILGAFDPEAGRQVVRYRGQVSRFDRCSQGQRCGSRACPPPASRPSAPAWRGCWWRRAALPTL
jgi:bifunctional enzyme CysN/CysC